MNDARRHNAMRHDENGVLGAIEIKILVHQSSNYIGTVSTYLSWWLSVLDERYFDEWAEKMDHAVMIVHAC